MRMHPSAVNTAALISLLLATALAQAVPDYAREQRWAKETLPAIIDGEPVYLQQENSHKFLGLYAEADTNPLAVVVVHGMGLHPDWGMIGTLRQDLFDSGYTTFSIQMPILAADASYKLYPAMFSEAAERLQLAVSYLKQKGFKKVVIVSHSNGSRMSRVFMSKNPSDVDAWVALSLTQGDTFKGINAPVFDLYGDDDLPHVLSSIEQRKKSFRNKKSKQLGMAGANHFFARLEKDMVREVKNYLDSLTNN